MTRQLSNQTQQQTATTSPLSSGILQRKCVSCGQHTIAGGECEGCQKKRSPLQRRSANQAEPAEVPPIVGEVLRSPGQPLDVKTRMFMEQRFEPDITQINISRKLGFATQGRLIVNQPNDSYEREADQVASSVIQDRTTNTSQVQSSSATRTHDFSRVRIHADVHAAEAARAIHARAFTVGQEIVFGANEYAPTSHTGRNLLAHELTHVIQQTGGVSVASSSGIVQRAPTISILDENFIGPPSSTQRRASRSCPITCCDQTLGTLHAMPLFFHQSRRAQVTAGSAAATGIGAAMHFIASSTQPSAPDRCHCDNFRIIQVLETTDPASGRGGNSYVDNSGQHTPFYSDVFLGGRGEHAVPAGYPDSGERLTTTESIYDRPYRDPATLPTTNLSWMAEACVACVKNNQPDRVLGGVTYGFTRTFNGTTRSFEPVVSVGPECRVQPSQHFINTLRSDPTTSSYDFNPAPGNIECAPMGDFPLPQGDTRMA